MTTYLGTFTIYDGEHEHTGYMLVKAKSMNEADRKLTAETHDVDNNTSGSFNYGDGMTASKLSSIRGLTPHEAKVVQYLNLASFV